MKILWIRLRKVECCRSAKGCEMTIAASAFMAKRAQRLGQIRVCLNKSSGYSSIKAHLTTEIYNLGARIALVWLKHVLKPRFMTRLFPSSFLLEV
jgi:hypothetical protein